MNSAHNPLDPNVVVSSTNPETPPSRKTIVPPSCLPDRQLEVLRAFALGETTKSIAARLNVSPKTVEYHRTALSNKLKLFCTAELVHYALATKLVAPLFDVTFSTMTVPTVTVDIGTGASQNWTAPLKRVVPIEKKKPVFLHKKKHKRRHALAMEKYTDTYSWNG